MDPAPADTALLGAWAEQWLATAVHLKPKTMAGYRSLLRSRIPPTFGASTLVGIRPPDVRRRLAAMRADGLSASRCRQAVHLLGAVLQTAVDDGWLVSSPCAGVRLPPLPLGEMAFLAPDQLRRLLATLRPDYRTLAALLAFGGLRFGEAAALRRGRCTLDRYGHLFDDEHGRLSDGLDAAYRWVWDPDGEEPPV